MEYNLFQDFARKLPRPAPPTGHRPAAPSQAVHWNLATAPKWDRGSQADANVCPIIWINHMTLRR